MLKGTPKNMSALRWYSWQLRLPSATQNWNRQWQGARAMSGRSPTFQALTTWRRDSGLVRMSRTTFLIWSIGLTSPHLVVGVIQLRHWAP